MKHLQAGSSPSGITSLHGYIPFQSRTGSNAGRTIYVKEEYYQLLVRMDELHKQPSSEAYYAIELMRSIERLRSQAMPANSFMKNAKNAPRSIVTSSFDIEYETASSHVQFGQTVTFITKIELKNNAIEDKQRAALWDIEWSEALNRWTSEKNPSSSIASKKSGLDITNPIKVAINGHCGSFANALNFMHTHISRGSEQINNILKKQGNGYKLFYVPYEGSSVKSGWMFVKSFANHRSDKISTEAAQILSDYMYEAYEKGLYVEWTSHRGGSKVLTEAMRQLALKQIQVGKKQSIFLSDPTSSVSAADQERRRIGMLTDGDWNSFKTNGFSQWAGARTFGLSGAVNAVQGIVNNPKSLGQWLSAPFTLTQEAVMANKHASAIAAMVATGTPPALASAWLSAASMGTLALTAGAGSMIYTALTNVPSLTQNYDSNPVKTAGNNLAKTLNIGS